MFFTKERCAQALVEMLVFKPTFSQLWDSACSRYQTLGQPQLDIPNLSLIIVQVQGERFCHLEVVVVESLEKSYLPYSFQSCLAVRVDLQQLRPLRLKADRGL